MLTIDTIKKLKFFIGYFYVKCDEILVEKKILTTLWCHKMRERVKKWKSWAGPCPKQKFGMFRSWWRVEADNDCMVNNIPENFSSMGFGVDFIKLHVWSCVHHVKFLRRWILWRAVVRTSRVLAWGVILPVKAFLLSPDCTHITFMEVLWDNQFVY